MANIFDLFKKIRKTPEGSAPEPISYLLVGLGNPGDKYKFTRHNSGFLMMDYLSQKENVSLNKLKFKALTAEAVLFGHRVLLMKPQTFINNSGEAVREAAAFYKIPPERILVFSDDISLPVGKLRLRRKGSDGGQKGLRSILLHIDSDAFLRIRFGIGEKPHPDYDLADWVLSDFSKEERELLFGCFEKAYSSLPLVLDGKIEEAMQLCNS